MNVSSVKNLNGETFSAVQDNFLTDIVSNNSANWNEISAYQANSGTFLTAHQDLSDYQTTAGMTAYQPVGDYLTTADSANFYTTANESGYLTAVPDTYLQNTDLSTTDGKVTAISGIPLSAGGDVPEGVMVESGLEYNAVNEISGYNGSAIAQYGAEKQWLVHDDTLVHAANSAQYALGVNLSAVAQLLGVDETLLWSGTDYSITDGSRVLSGEVELSEAASAFEKIAIWMSGACSNEIIECVPRINSNLYQRELHEIKANKIVVAYYGRLKDWTHFSAHGSYSQYSANGDILYNGTEGWWGYSQPYKIIGIGRKS